MSARVILMPGVASIAAPTASACSCRRMPALAHKVVRLLELRPAAAYVVERLVDDMIADAVLGQPGGAR